MMILRRLAARSMSMCETPAPAKRLLQIALQLQVFEQELAELLLRKPVRVPVLVVAEPKAVWMNFLSHNFLQF